MRDIVQCCVDPKSCSAELKIERVTWGMAQEADGTLEGTNSMCEDWSEEGTVHCSAHSALAQCTAVHLVRSQTVHTTTGQLHVAFNLAKNKLHSILWGNNDSSQPDNSRMSANLCWFALDVNNGPWCFGFNVCGYSTSSHNDCSTSSYNDCSRSSGDDTDKVIIFKHDSSAVQ